MTSDMSLLVRPGSLWKLSGGEIKLHALETVLHIVTVVVFTLPAIEITVSSTSKQAAAVYILVIEPDDQNRH